MCGQFRRKPLLPEKLTDQPQRGPAVAATLGGQQLRLFNAFHDDYWLPADRRL
jgi:hypothetical protein